VFILSLSQENVYELERTVARAMEKKLILNKN